MAIKGTRLLRYVLNRPDPEPKLFASDIVTDLVMSGMKLSGDLWVPEREEQLSYAALVNHYYTPMQFPSYMNYRQPEAPAAPLVEPEFEGNLTEALVGWRGWYITDDHIISLNAGIPWDPDVPMIAICRAAEHEDCPREHCTCGVYALDETDDLSTGVHVMGQVYGWGRYVRGNNGWRAQYAYPKCFYISSGQETHLDVLKRYHVPIYMMAPIEIYNPEEDGYECRGNEAYGNRGTITNPDPAEGGCASNEDEED